jgi:serine/threonine protein kinase
LPELHGFGIFHRDIEAANILLRKADDPTGVCLGDFSSCYVAPPRVDSDEVDVAAAGSALSTTIAGTPYYLAPEIGWFFLLLHLNSANPVLLVKGVPYSAKVHVWSVGVLL